MRLNQRTLPSGLLALWLTGGCSLTALSAGFTTANIIAASTRPDCVDWRVRGVCLKLQCGWFGCRVRSRPWIEHRFPELVVSAYNEPGQIPWQEAGSLLGQPIATAAQAVSSSLIGQPLGGGHTGLSRPGVDREGRGITRNLRYKEVSVIGHPAGRAFRDWLADRVPMMCPSAVHPWRPYFASELDAVAWRTGLGESLLAASPTARRRQVGHWSPLYPRTGTVRQYHDVLAAAVAAQRAVDIVTRAGQPHRYEPVPGVPAANEATDRWQMIHPRSDSQCQSFGTDSNYFVGRENRQGPDEGSYGWLYWPLHQCCPGSGRTLARLSF